MRITILILVAVMLLLGMTGVSHAEIKWIDGYYRHNGEYVDGHYRDTSNDGNPYNNANYLGYN